jgi:glycosyltransferase involved in cell wall biosynthesis
VEAQACGTPVILTNAHTGPELVGPGWLVGAQEFWNERHQGVWWTPSIKGMHDALCKARDEAARKREAARAFAEGFDADVIWPLWEKLLGGV